MKRLVTLLLTLAMVVCLLPVNAYAATVGDCGQNLDWYFHTGKGTLTISGSGSMWNYQEKNKPAWSEFYGRMFNNSLRGAVIIQPGVTSIGNYSFYGWSNLWDASIGHTVTHIGDYAFAHCDLGSVELPYNLRYIGNGAFYTSGLSGSLVLFYGLNYIGDNAFSWNELTSVVIPDSVSLLGVSAFAHNQLTSASLPMSLVAIPNYVFYDNALTSISIPGYVSTIGKSAFAKNALTQVTIPSSVTTIGEDAFAENALTNIALPNSVVTIGAGAFRDNSLSNVTIPGSVKTIGESAFAYNNLTDIVIPDTITSMGAGALTGNELLTSASLPANLTEIPADTFSGCVALTDFTMPAGITQIGAGAFENCDALETFTIPGGVTSVAADAFSSCDNLNTIIFEGNAPQIGDGCFTGVTATAYYPINNPTWTEDVMRSYGGILTWEPYGPLEITTQPENVSVASGETAKVTVEATGVGLSYHWYYKNTGDSYFTYTSSFKGNTYSVSMNDARNGRQVFCRVYDRDGNMVQTNTVALSMKKTTVKITRQPVSVVVAEGETAKVAVSAVGDGLTYRWYYKNVGESSYTYTSSFKGNTYSVAMNEARNGRQVLCRVYDKYGNVVQTNTVKLSMKNTVKITQQPVSVTVAEGATAKVTVKATGDGLIYRWYYKDVGMSSYTYTSSYKGSTYSVPMTEARNGRQLLCRVYDQYGNVVQTNTVILKMK